MNDLYALFRQSLAGLRLLVVADLVLGLAYPAVVFGFGQVAAPWQARGSLVTETGRHTTDPATRSAPRCSASSSTTRTCSRTAPVAAGDGYDPLSTVRLQPRPRGARAARGHRRAQGRGRRARGGRPSDVPPDAVTASASGLDPDISEAYAALQVPRVAAATGLSEDAVREPGRRAHQRAARSASWASPRSTCCCSTSRSPEPRRPLSMEAGHADRAARGRLTVYLGAAPGVGQDLRHARRGAPPARARHRRRGRRRRDPRPRADRGPARGSRGRAPAQRGAPRVDVHRDGHRRDHRPRPAVVLVDELAHTNVPGSRHEKRAAGRRRAPRRRHRRDHHRQHPAPGVAQRRGRADHRRPPARDRAGRRRPRRRPDPARRHGPRRAAPPDGARQHLPGRQHRRLADVVLPASATSPRCASSPCSGWPTGSTTSSTTTAARTGSRRPGRPRSASSSR